MGNDIFDILNNPVLPFDDQIPIWGQKFGASQFPPTNAINNANNKTNFKSASQDVWKTMRQGTSYQQREINTGPYTSNFYGLKKEEGVDLPGLISFINKSISDCTVPFYWKDFEKQATYTHYRHRDTEGGFIDEMKIIDNTIPFVYTNETGIKQTASFSVKMNKRTDYLEDKYGFSLNIGKKSISANLFYFYDNTIQFRNPTAETSFSIYDKYLAVSFTTNNLVDFCYLIKAIEGDDQFKLIQSIIIERYAEAILNSKSNATLNFLYKHIPDFVIKELSGFIKPDIMFTHIQGLTDLDDKERFHAFKDSSNALINCMQSFGNAEYLYQQFENNPKLLKEIFYNLDGASVVEGEAMSNKLIFASLLSRMALIYSKDKTIRGNFKISEGKGFGAYKIDAHTLFEDGTEKKENSFYLQQQTTTFTPGIYIPYNKGIDDGDYYCPLDLVWLTKFPKKETDGKKDKVQKPTKEEQKDNKPEAMLVAAILVKALAHEQQVQDIQKVIRIGIDIFAVVLTVATAGSSMPLATAIMGIGLPTVDIVVASEEDELKKSPLGQAFLDAYNGIMVAGAIAATPMLIGSFYRGFAFLFKNVVLEPSKKFLISAMIAVNNELSATNYIKGTEKIIIFEYKTVCTEVGYHFLKNSTVRVLAEENVILTSGQVQVEKQLVTQYTAIYEGVPIAEGSMQEVRATLESLVKNKNFVQILRGVDAFMDELAALGKEGEVAFWKHIDGEVIPKDGGRGFKSIGGHNYQKVVDGEMKIVGDTIPPNPKADEPFVAKVQVKDPAIANNWINKSNSTLRINGKQERMATSFFPKNWKLPRIKFEMGYAFGNKVLISTKHEQGVLVETFRGKCSVGWEIEFIYNDGILKTIVPVVKNI